MNPLRQWQGFVQKFGVFDESSVRYSVLCALAMAGLAVIASAGEELSRSFELRQFSANPAANGETDFRGETAVMNTEERVAFLKTYADVSRRFFRDPELATKVVSEDAVAAAVEAFKPMPQPTVRDRHVLDSWRWLGSREGQSEASAKRQAVWEETSGLRREDGALVFRDAQEWDLDFPSQSWRASFSFRARAPADGQPAAFVFSDKGKVRAATVGFGDNGRLFYTTANNERVDGSAFEPGSWHRFKLEFDFAAFARGKDLIRYNLYIDDALVADFVPMQRVVTEGVGYAVNFTTLAFINRFSVEGASGLAIDDIWGVGYHFTGRDSYPYSVETFLDENFEIKPALGDWTHVGYDDDRWGDAVLPFAHGSERYAGEDLYLRTEVTPALGYERAILHLETLDPGGEVWVNGRVAAVIDKRHATNVDITRFLRSGKANVIGLRVNHFYLTEDVGELMPHSSLDFNVGWFAGRAHLDLVGHTALHDVFLYTESLGDDGNATLRAEIEVDNDYWLSFRGAVEVRLFPWFPEESTTPVATSRFPVTIGKGIQKVEHAFEVSRPDLWTPEAPHLYRVQVRLLDDAGEQIDDLSTTTGIRTLGQEGGVFRLNGEVYMANGAQIFGYRAPVEDMVTHNRCAPEAWIAKEILMIKNMNGNLLRIHSHAWEFPARGINDPRYAEYADQMGMLLLWCPTSWIRTGRGWGDIDFEGFPKDMRQVRNHPSIAFWEAANHTQSFKSRDVAESNIYVEQVYDLTHDVDPSRLISVNSFIEKLHYGNDAGRIDFQGNPIEPAPEWTAPMITRGNQDSPTGYGKTWDVLRKWPAADRADFLASQDRAYFNFEHEESIGQNNWNLVRGKPWYRLHSYEWRYDEGSIGRRLTLEEWAESQAWQGFSAWEAMKKMRLLDYDGFSWCCLHGGPNSVTYKKPLIDFHDHAKIGYWVNKMVFQRTVAGSADVDTVYGPDDEIRPVILHWGEAMRVDLEVLVQKPPGETVERRIFRGVELEAGRQPVELKSFRPKVPGAGVYVIEYRVLR